MKIYKGHRDIEAGGQIVFVRTDDDPPKVYELPHIVRYSPDGFNWGYGGSGPADLALSILADFFGTEEIPPNIYQQFKRKFIEPVGGELRITGNEILDWTKDEVWFQILAHNPN